MLQDQQFCTGFNKLERLYLPSLKTRTLPHAPILMIIALMVICFPFSSMPGELIVKLKPGSGPAQMNHPAKPVFSTPITSHQTYLRSLSEMGQFYVLDIKPNEDMNQVIREYMASGNVESVEKVQYLHAQTVKKDPKDQPTLIDDPYLFSSGSIIPNTNDLWGIGDIEAEAAWDQANGAGAVVAVIDSGVDINHPDMGLLWINALEANGILGIDDDNNGHIDDIHGFDFTQCYEFNEIQTPDGTEYGSCRIPNMPSGDISDENGHGTHVAGTIAASGGNSLGVVGVAFKSKIMSIKALNKQGTGRDPDIAKAITYAADNGADIINMSLGGQGRSQIIEIALQYAYDLNVVLISSAGNDAVDIEQTFYSPASFSTTIAVSSLDTRRNRSGFSNYGNLVSVAGPGSSILSLNSQDIPNPSGLYSVKSGTSMSAPHVAGVAALLKSIRKNLSPLDVQTILEDTAIDLGTPGFNGGLQGYGHGLVNANNAVMHLLNKVNDPPVIVLAQDVFKFSEDSFAKIPFDLQDSDQKDYQISVAFTQLPNNIVYEPGSKHIRWLPNALPKGSHTVEMTAFDGLETTSKTFSIEISRAVTGDASKAASISEQFHGCRSNQSMLYLILWVLLMLMSHRFLRAIKA